MVFNKVSYRRSIIEGLVLFILGRLGVLISPALFPDWLFVLLPLLFRILVFVLPPYWATRRLALRKGERLSKRLWLLGPFLAVICLGLDILFSLVCGPLPLSLFGVSQGPAFILLTSNGAHHLSWSALAMHEAEVATILFSLYVIIVICTRLSGTKFLRFTMPAGENRVTL